MTPADRPPQANPDDVIRHILLTFNDRVRPFHEWLAGQRAYFVGQGYTDDEARAMAASLFVSLFGTGITRTPTTDPEGDNP